MLSSVYQQRATVSQRTSWSILLFLIALATIGIGVGTLLGGAEATIAIGVLFAIYSFILALPASRWG